jgi:hypothetical protein
MAASRGARLLLEGSARRWLGGFTSLFPKVLWDIGIGRHRQMPTLPFPGIATHRIIAALISKPVQLLENTDQCYTSVIEL